jgi:hypothetical protein
MLEKIPSVIISQMWKDYHARKRNEKKKEKRKNKKAEGTESNIEETTVRKY